MIVKMVLAMFLISQYVYSMDLKQCCPNLKSMLVEPASLKFQAAWYNVANNKNLEDVGEPNIIELGNKIRKIQESTKCKWEKKLFINLLNNAELDDDKIREHFKYLLYYEYFWVRPFKNKAQLLDAMLLNACSKDNIELGELSIIMGANPNTRDNISIGRPPLALAIKNGNIAIVQLLINSGADINDKFETEGSSVSPLILATTKNRISIVQLLINSGADINTKDEAGSTALSIATAKGYEQIAQMLSQET